MSPPKLSFFFFFFNDTATTEIYTLSLHDALPISRAARPQPEGPQKQMPPIPPVTRAMMFESGRSEEHTSELQSRPHLVCRLLLEKKKNNKNTSFSKTESSHAVNWHQPCVTVSDLR